MFQKHPKITLDMKYINKFGFNEYGKNKWSTTPEEDKVTKIREVMKGIDLDKALQISGFNNFVKVLSEMLKPEEQIRFCQTRNFYQFCISDNLSFLENKSLVDNIDKIIDYYNKIKYLSVLSNNIDDIEKFKNSFIDCYFWNYNKDVISKYYNKSTETVLLKNLKTHNDKIKKIEIIHYFLEILVTEFDGIFLTTVVKEFNEAIKNLLKDLYEANLNHGKIEYVDNLVKLGFGKINIDKIFEGFWLNEEDQLFKVFEDLELRKLTTKEYKISKLEKIMTDRYLNSQFVTNFQLSSQDVCNSIYWFYIEKFWESKISIKNNMILNTLYICKIRNREWITSAKQMPLEKFSECIGKINTKLEDYYFTILSE